jgi:hypothetical protein
MKLRGGEVAVVRGKDGRFRVTIPKDLALALGLEGGERGKFRLLRLSSTQVVLSLEIARKRGKAGEGRAAMEDPKVCAGRSPSPRGLK